MLADSGSDPVWDCKGSMTYHGEVALEISVWDFVRPPKRHLCTHMI